MSEMRAPYRLLGPRLHMLVVLTAALAMAAPPFTVLCHGEDGHLELESAFDTCCRQVARVAGPGAAADAQCGDECGHCTDVPVRNQLFLSARTELVTPAVLPWNVTAASRRPAQSPVFEPVNASSPDPTLTLLATTTLLL